jgi:MFS family permease
MSFLGGGVAIAWFGATTNFYFACVALFFGGLFWLWSFNSAFAAIQMLVPDAMRGRVMALVNVAVFGSMAIGPFLTGQLGSGLNAGSIHISPGLGVQIGVAGTGVVLVIASLVMLIWRTPEVDGLKAGDAGYERQPGLLRGILATAHRPRA